MLSRLWGQFADCAELPADLHQHMITLYKTYFGVDVSRDVAAASAYPTLQAYFSRYVILDPPDTVELVVERALAASLSSSSLPAFSSSSSLKDATTTTTTTAVKTRAREADDMIAAGGGGEGSNQRAVAAAAQITQRMITESGGLVVSPANAVVTSSGVVSGVKAGGCCAQVKGEMMTIDAIFRHALPPIPPTRIESGERSCPATPTHSSPSQQSTTTTGESSSSSSSSSSSLSTTAGGGGGDIERQQQHSGGQNLCRYYVTMALPLGGYHHFHSPAAMRILSTVTVPGELLPAGPHSLKWLPRVITSNERVCIIAQRAGGGHVGGTPPPHRINDKANNNNGGGDSSHNHNNNNTRQQQQQHNGWIGVAAVGGMLRGCVKMSFDERIETNLTDDERSGQHIVISRKYGKAAPLAQIGDELGRFDFGSAIVVVFDGPEGLHIVPEGTELRVGQSLFTPHIPLPMNDEVDESSHRSNPVSAAS